MWSLLGHCYYNQGVDGFEDKAKDSGYKVYEPCRLAIYSPP
jgi:hypothetical protein